MLAQLKHTHQRGAFDWKGTNDSYSLWISFMEVLLLDTSSLSSVDHHWNVIFTVIITRKCK